MRKFSIIVPCYNNEQYLESCLNSILEQNYDSWETVIVIDASPDNSFQVAQSFASKDARFKVINKDVNGGLHLARKTGVKASTGDYITFLDADDEFFPGTLCALSNVVDNEGSLADIIHFGLKCSETQGGSIEARTGFEGWANSEDCVLNAAEAMRKTFAKDGGYCRDWNLCHRLFEGNLARSVFEQLSVERLESAEDGYEYFAIVSQSHGELVRDSIVGYKYFMGRGVTNSNEVTAKDYANKVNKIAACANATIGYANACKAANATNVTNAAGGIKADGIKTDGINLVTTAHDFESRLIFSIANEWFEQVCDNEKLEAARLAMGVLDSVKFASEIARFVRDRACKICLSSEEPTAEEVKEIDRWYELACNGVSGVNLTDEQYVSYFSSAKDWLEDAHKVLDCNNPSRKDITIYVSTHKEVELYDSEILQPVLCGAINKVGNKVGNNGAGGNAGNNAAGNNGTGNNNGVGNFASNNGTTNNKKFQNMIFDNDGENISDLNPMYCEMTVQYWAWKNSTSPYVGFCHYRRYFNFSNTEFEENPAGEIDDEFIDMNTQLKYGLIDSKICEALQGHDVVTTREQDIRRWTNPDATNRSLYADAPHLRVEDLDTAVAILIAKHPEYEEDAMDFLTDNKACFCNMYVMRREIFNEYCEWLFPILEQFCKTTDMTLYSHEGLRTPGHLAERLFNIYMRHKLRTGCSWRIKRVQCVHFLKPEKHDEVKVIDTAENPNNLPVIPVVFAADDKYVPMLTTTLYSMLKNASKDYFYDVIVLQKDIQPSNAHKMRAFFAVKFENASLQFVDVSHIVGKYNLKTNNPHISEETYYRFLIQELLPHYNKVLYLDSDLIIKGNVSELFNVSLGTNLVGAVPDIDFTGNVNMTDGLRLKYTREVLKMIDPYSYFQAGVLVLNTQGMREFCTMEQWLEFASNNGYIYNDQDALNAKCQGRVKYLPYEWNVMNDCCGRINKVFTHAPAKIYDAYVESRKHEKIVHYAGFEKPWSHTHCDRFELYWEYARETPFYERLIEILCSERTENYATDIYEHINHLIYERIYARVYDRIEAGERAVYDKIWDVEHKHERVLGEEHNLRKLVDPIAPVGSRRREALKGLGRTLRGRR